MCALLGPIEPQPYRIVRPSGDSVQDFVFLRVLPAQETHNDKYCPIDEKTGISKDFPWSYRPKKCEKGVTGCNEKYPEKNVLGPSFTAQTTSGEIAEENGCYEQHRRNDEVSADDERLQYAK